MGENHTIEDSKIADWTYDVIVVGSGPAGGWATKELTEKGLDVLLLEAGPELDPDEDFPTPEHTTGDDLVALRTRAKAALSGQPIQSRCFGFSPFNGHLYVDDRDCPYSYPWRRPFLWFRCRQLGGKLHTWGRVALRMSDLDFKAASHDGHGQDWPLSSRDLEPYYAKVERFLGLSGNEDGVAHLPDGVYSTEHKFTEPEGQLMRVMADLSSDYVAIAPRQVPILPNHRSPTIEAAKSTGRLTIRPNSVVKRLVVDPVNGKVVAAACLDAISKRRFEARASVFVLAASAIESVRILLNSACRRHPDGLGNSSGQLGRYLMDHCVAGLWGPAPPDAQTPPPLTVDVYDTGKTTGIYVPRFQNLKAQRESFLRGYGMQGGVGRFHSKHRNPGERVASWSLSTFGEMLPRPENRVTLNHRRTDAWGIPTVRIDCRYSENEHAMIRHGLSTIERIVKAAGYRLDRDRGFAGRLRDKLMRRYLVPGATIHESGGARMGNDPASSVLNRYNQCWDAPNVFVTDGACFVSTGCQNTGLTIMAITARACERIHAEYRGGSL